MRLFGKLLIACLAGGLLVACSSEPAPAPKQQGKASGKPAFAPAPEAAVVEEEPEEYRYDPTGKPDPFRSFVRLEDELDEGMSTPLERFDLSQLEVTAIIWSTERPRALIRDPAGKGYIISTGAPIGKNKGRVVAIHDGVVQVEILIG